MFFLFGGLTNLGHLVLSTRVFGFFMKDVGLAIISIIQQLIFKNSLFLRNYKSMVALEKLLWYHYMK